MIDLNNYINKVLVFYNPEKAGYWNSITKCCIKDRPLELGEYYLDFSSKAAYPNKFSADGIPLFTYGSYLDVEQPVVIAQYALGLGSLLAKDNFDNKELGNKFINAANWFVQNKEQFKDGVGWYIKILHPHYGLNAPWISAMAQGEAISVLTRAAKITKNELYEKIAMDALVPFEYKVEEGGIVNYFKSIPVYEEAPSTPKTMAVLNGFIFSLFGLYDLYLLNKNIKAYSLFTNGVEALLKLLPYYDFNTWTNYFLYEYPKKYYSSYTYHVLVTEQLKALYILTGEQLFNQYAKKWEGYSKSFVKKNVALFQKIFFSNKINP
jgi:hypothetical protein